MCIVYCCGCVFFFFKQKTAYEMRISDWSSDVCSSDLEDPALDRRPSRPACMVRPVIDQPSLRFQYRLPFACDIGFGEDAGRQCGPAPKLGRERCGEESAHLLAEGALLWCKQIGRAHV